MESEPNALVKALDQLYDRAVDGIPGFASVEELAADYLEGSGSLEEKVDALIRWQVAKASTSGFLTGLGGVLTLPVTIPANLVSVTYVQLRMVAVIAHLGGYNVREDRVKTFCYMCLCGNAAKDVLKDVGIVTGNKLAVQGIRRLPVSVIYKINGAAGFRILTKFGQKGVVNLGRAVPLVGGAVGGTFDGVATRTVGKAAKNLFIAGSGTSTQQEPQPTGGGGGGTRMSSQART